MRAHIIVRRKHVCLLLHQKLPQRQWQLPIQRILIRLFRNILALLRGIEQCVITAAQLRLQIGPDAMDWPPVVVPLSLTS